MHRTEDWYLCVIWLQYHLDLYGNAVAECGTNTLRKKWNALYPFWMEKETFQLVALSKYATVNLNVYVCVWRLCVSGAEGGGGCL